jgi:hypothetical protein
VAAAVKGSTTRGPLIATVIGEAALSTLKTEFKKHQTPDDNGVSALGLKCTRDHRIEKLFDNMSQSQKQPQQSQLQQQQKQQATLQQQVQKSLLDSMLFLVSMSESSIVQNCGKFEQCGKEVLARLGDEKWKYSVSELEVMSAHLVSLVEKLTKIGSLDGLKNRASSSLVELMFLLYSEPVDWLNMTDDDVKDKFKMLQSDVEGVADLYKQKIGLRRISKDPLDPLQKEAMELQAQVLPLVAGLYHLVNQRQYTVDRLPEDLCNIMKNLGQFEACGYIPIPPPPQVLPDFIDTKTRWGRWSVLKKKPSQ